MCGAGTLGLVTMAEKQDVTYPDGKKAVAWVGVKINSANGDVLSPWSSRNPAVLGVTLFDLMLVNKRLRSLSMAHMYLPKYIPERWPTVLHYTDPAQVRRISEWLAQGNLQLIKDRREASNVR